MSQSSNEAEGLAEGPEGDEPMSFFEHLAELRRRLIYASVGIISGFGLCWAFRWQLYDLLVTPFYDAWTRLVQEGLITGEPQLLSLSPLDAFLTNVRIAATAAIFVAGPVLFYQLWMFVAPGLYKSEKRLVVPFVATSVVMFSLGAGFCYEMVVPFATEWFLRYPLEDAGSVSVKIIPQYALPEYVTYTTKLLVGFGLMFEMPLAIFFLAKAGMVTHRTLLRFWKIAIMLIVLASAFLTPPDPITLMFMAVPMASLFFMSVGIAYLVSRPDGEALETASGDQDGQS